MKTLIDLKTELDQYTGLFLDGWAAFQLFEKRMSEGFEAKTPSEGVVTLSQTSARMSYLSAGPPPQPGEDNSPPLELHTATPNELTDRNSENGSNHIFFRRMVLVGFYHRWDEFHRHQIAAEFDVDANKVNGDIFGDIRHIRNSIIHGKGIAQDNISKTTILKWFSPGDEIDIDIDKFFVIKQQVELWISATLVKAGCQ